MSPKNVYLCDSCNKIIPNDQVHVHYQDGEQYFFHKNNQCYPAWVHERMREDAELADEWMR